MKEPTSLIKCSAWIVVAVFSLSVAQAATSTIFDDFNVNEGHFNQHPTYSGSTAGVLATSTADRMTTGGPLEGTGYEHLVLYTNGAASARVRFLSGLGTPANNVAFTTSAGADGWIGCYIRTTNEGWNVQLWIEGASVNGGIPKDIVPDGQWHLIEWNLDDDSGGADGWGTIAGLVTGTATVTNGSHTIDSLMFRNTTLPYGTNVIDVDFVARNDLGSVADLITAPCLSTPGVLVNGPISTNSNDVFITSALAEATKITVYQDTGSGYLPVGTKTTDITAGNNTVTVSGLVKGAKVVATQTVAGQESCIPSSWLVVGGGANPPIRLALSLRENPTATGPVGANGSTGWNNNMHFMPGKTVFSGYTPGEGAIVIQPGNDWQTVSVERGNVSVGDVANVTGTAVNGPGYAANDGAFIQVYAYKSVPALGAKVFSAIPFETPLITSNDVFKISLSWTPVAGADGYRLVRSLNYAGYYHYLDVTTATFTDANTGWTYSDVVVVDPKTSPLNPSIMWYPTPGSVTNFIDGEWAVLESIALACEGDSGPYDIFIDNLANGTHGVFQDFEGFTNNTPGGAGFQPPAYSSTTEGSLTPAPNAATITDLKADTGVNSLRVRWQFKSAVSNQWVRLTTYQSSAMPSPLVDLSQPISFRILVLPVGSTPTPPPAISVSKLGESVVLNWTGTFNLQAASVVTGPYTNTGVVNGPWTNTFTEPLKFFRLSN